MKTTEDLLKEYILDQLQNNPAVQARIGKIANDMLDELEREDPAKYAELKEFFQNN